MEIETVAPQKELTRYEKFRMCHRKRLYITRDEAERAIRSLLKNGRAARWYQCPECKGFHITHTR